VAVGRRRFLNVWGTDYPTQDGIGVRDFIHNRESQGTWGAQSTSVHCVEPGHWCGLQQRARRRQSLL